MEHCVLGKGERVYIRHPGMSDAKAFLSAVKRSHMLHTPWVSPPSTMAKYREYVERQKNEAFDGLLVLQRDDDALVGVYNIGHMQLGPLCSAYLGYYGFEPGSGNGLMREGMELVLRRAFTKLGLHRVEANIQPGNERSLSLVKRIGFTKEGYSRRYLKIRGRWCDHERWAILKEDWRAQHTRRTSRG